MDYSQFFVFHAVSVLILLLVVEGKTNPPENFQVYISGNSVIFTWTIPEHTVLAVRLAVFDSHDKYMLLDSRLYKDIVVPESSFKTSALPPCEEYTVQARSWRSIGFSDIVEKKFWLTAKNITGNIDTDVIVSWKTQYSFFNVEKQGLSPFYTVDPGGNIISNSIDSKYIIDTTSTSVQDIRITLINVTQTDGGIYKSVSPSVSSNTINECCLLIVTDKPMRPVLTTTVEAPFVGDNITFICTSEVQRWPAGVPSSITYKFKFFGRGEQQDEKLVINSLTVSDKGANISCQATDDLGKISDISNTISLDPFYGPDDVNISPAYPEITMTEGNTLGPITCLAQCYPECDIVWERKTNGRFEQIGNIGTTATLFKSQASKVDSGQYRCTAKHQRDELRRSWKDVHVNVLYPPLVSKAVVRINDGSPENDSATYTLKEGDYVQVTLTVDSNPVVFLTMNIPGSAVTNLKFEKIDNDYDFLLPRLDCKNSGTSTIDAGNGIKKNARWNITFNIHCEPKELQVFREKIGAQLGATETISLLVVSNPKPNIIWDSDGDNLDTWNIQFVKRYQYNASSSVRIREETDFRHYTLRIWNTVGVIFQSITIVPRGKPDQPKYFDYGNVTLGEVDLSWVAGFDNGGKQNFVINVKSENDKMWKSISIPGGRIREGTRMDYTLTGLLPKRSYCIYLLASNEYGTSNSSLHFTTKDAADRNETSEKTSTTTWIICLVIIAVIAGLSHLLRTCILKVSRKRNLINERKMKNDDSQDRGLYEEVEETALNIVSLSVTSKETSGSIGNTAVDKGDSSSMDSEEDDNKNADVEQELQSQEHPYNSLEENWRCNTHTYGDTSNFS